MSANKLAVALHVYYEDMWPFIAGYLKNIEGGFDLFVTCRDEIAPALTAVVHADYPQAEVICIENVGMDVIPFIRLCGMRRLDRYRAVLKLHTKNQKSDLRRAQGEVMFDGLCGTPQLVADIRAVFDRDENAGMVGAAFQVRSANALMYGNRAKVADLMHLLGMQIFDWPFFTGTMFWIAGPLLSGLAQNADTLATEAALDVAVGSGKDGTTAHALERLFGGLPKAARRTTYVTERKSADCGKHLVMPIESHGPCNDWRYLQSESTDIMARIQSAPDGCRTIARSGEFDAGFYARNSMAVAVPGMDPIYHFYLFGDVFGTDPSPRFNVNYYLTYRNDVARKKVCSFLHYLKAGKKEERSTQPTVSDWLSSASRIGLFNPEFYDETYGDVGLLGMEPADHYAKIGRFLERKTSRSLELDDVPAISNSVLPQDQFAYYMNRVRRDEALLYEAITKASNEGDYEFVITCGNLLKSRFGRTPAVIEGEATYYTINNDWDAASRLWDEYWDKRKLQRIPNRHRRTITKIDRPTTANWATFDTVEPQGQRHAVKAHRICIYTTLFGDIDDIVPVISPVEGVDYICFTDRPRAESGWRQVICDPDLETDNLKAKTFKILPHKHLADYDYSMFVDANTLFLGNVRRLIDICLDGGDWVMFQHPLRDDVYLESCAIIGHLRHAPEKILAQIRYYAEQGLPRASGMIEASFIWRRHANPEVAAFMDHWWQEILGKSSRDQLSLGYLLWKTQQKPKVLPESIGTSRNNKFFFKLPHRDGKNLHDATPRQTPSRDIVFVYAPQFQATGSTYLRGNQLSTIMRGHYDGTRDVAYTADTNLADRILVLTKGFLKTTTPEALAELRRSNILIADFVDEPPIPALVDHVDALMASSLLGYRDYLIRFPQKQAFHVTHHVDLRIADPRHPLPSFNAGYFGELVNTIIDDDISRHVSFNLVDTSKQSDDWLTALGNYSFHYALRRSRGIDGAKPFLKGFVAAHCGANMMIQDNAGDASFYLGDDYPYLLPQNCTNAEILDAVRFAQDSFDGPEWHYGMDIMRSIRSRSDRAHVAKEFDAMIRAL